MSCCYLFSFYYMFVLVFYCSFFFKLESTLFSYVVMLNKVGWDWYAILGILFIKEISLFYVTLLPTFTPSQSYSSTWSLHGFLLGPGFATGADQHKQPADFSKWKAVIKETRGANMHNFLWPLSLSALSLHLLPYVFIYPVMWVAVQRQPNTRDLWNIWL